ncbi:hypothetical protein NDU88_011768 [Pleurodeles waltl]|uniref:Uncharacterized protein n=1 Tax=Pleurodeles waltl TaxID=8319 RepID=A0AAV7QY78_PLEWA|nr:hypothetical protein NDU88_011768 [Pleurodeles waltl]
MPDSLVIGPGPKVHARRPAAVGPALQAASKQFTSWGPQPYRFRPEFNDYGQAVADLSYELGPPQDSIASFNPPTRNEDGRAVTPAVQRSCSNSVDTQPWDPCIQPVFTPGTVRASRGPSSGPN